jgi:hypothetical protein
MFRSFSVMLLRDNGRLQALSIHCAGLSHLKQWKAGVIGVDRRSVEGILRALAAPSPDLADPKGGC